MKHFLLQRIASCFLHDRPFGSEDVEDGVEKNTSSKQIKSISTIKSGEIYHAEFQSLSPDIVKEAGVEENDVKEVNVKENTVEEREVFKLRMMQLAQKGCNQLFDPTFDNQIDRIDCLIDSPHIQMKIQRQRQIFKKKPKFDSKEYRSLPTEADTSLFNSIVNLDPIDEFLLIIYGKMGCMKNSLNSIEDKEIKKQQQYLKGKKEHNEGIFFIATLLDDENPKKARGKKIPPNRKRAEALKKIFNIDYRKFNRDERERLRDLAVEISHSTFDFGTESRYKNRNYWFQLYLKLNELMGETIDYKHIQSSSDETTLPFEDEFHCKLFVKMSKINKDSVGDELNFRDVIFTNGSGYEFLMNIIHSKGLLNDNMKAEASKEQMNKLIDYFLSSDMSDFSLDELDLLQGFLFKIILLHSVEGDIARNNNLEETWANVKATINKEIQVKRKNNKSSSIVGDRWLEVYLSSEDNFIFIVFNQHFKKGIEEAKSVFLKGILVNGTSERFLLDFLKSNNLYKNSEQMTAVPEEKCTIALDYLIKGFNYLQSKSDKKLNELMKLEELSFFIAMNNSDKELKSKEYKENIQNIEKIKWAKINKKITDVLLSEELESIKSSMSEKCSLSSDNSIDSIDQFIFTFLVSQAKLFDAMRPSFFKSTVFSDFKKGKEKEGSSINYFWKLLKNSYLIIHSTSESCKELQVLKFFNAVDFDDMELSKTKALYIYSQDVTPDENNLELFKLWMRLKRSIALSLINRVVLSKKGEKVSSGNSNDSNRRLPHVRCLLSETRE